VKRHFKQIKKLSEGRGASSRLRFMLQELMALRDNAWVPRREEEKAKTIRQVHQDIARETGTKISAIRGTTNAGASSSGGGGGGDAAAAAGGAAAAGEDDWVTVTTKTKPKGKADDGRSAGGAGRMGGGATAGRGGGGDATRRPTGGTATGSAFAALGEGDRKKKKEKDERRERKDRKDSKDRDRGDKDRGDRRDKKDRDKREHRKDSSKLSKLAAVTVPAASPGGSAAAAGLTEAEVRRRGRDAFDEYAVGGDLDEAALCFRELQPAEHLWAVVAECANVVLERRDADRRALARLLAALASRGILGEGDLRRGLSDVLEFLPDIEIDVPMATAYLAKMVGELLAAAALGPALLT
ncbi:unnamed protein product, partial [Phaeothamnion confervicola]